MNKKWVSLCLAMISIILLSGCWDRVEIEDRAFIVGMAIDMKEKEQSAEIGEERSSPRFLSTFQLAVMEGFQTGQESVGQAFANKSAEGDTILETVSEAATRMGRQPFFQHMKVVVVSEAIARKPNVIAHVLDYFLRSAQCRRGTLLFISKGEAKDTLEYAKEQKIPALNLESLTDNFMRSPRMAQKVTLGEVHEKLLKNAAYILPAIQISQDKEVEMSGSAVLSQANILVGLLNDEETEGYNFLIGNIKGGMLEFVSQGKKYVFEIKRMSHQLKSKISKDHQVQFQIKL